MSSWDAALYNKEQGFVAEFGKSLLSYLDPTPGQRIWDLGCGTGTLTSQIAEHGAVVVGTDSSPEMIELAKKSFPGICFEIQDATTANFETPFDSVFSNAVFHWIPQQTSLLRSINRALRPGGKLVCEMGAKGNIASIESALTRAFSKRGIAYESIFYFPSLNDYGALLDAFGFDISYMRAYARPTPFEPGQAGLSHWIRQFYHSVLSSFSEAELATVISEMEEELRPVLWSGDRWIADYWRLRFVAIKRG